MKRIQSKLIIPLLFLLLLSCGTNVSSNLEMINLLATIAKDENVMQNNFAPEAKLDFYSAMLKKSSNYKDSAIAEYFVGKALLELGDEEKSLEAFEALYKTIPATDRNKRNIVMRDIALTWMRIGERMNCIHNHSSQSCVFPIQGQGVHLDKTGSEKAIEIYESILKDDPKDLESRWLLNIAYMTIGAYPQKVPEAFLIKGLNTDTSSLVKPFIDVAVNTGLNTKNMAGGSIVEDFNNDGYLDLITSSWALGEGMHYCKNNGNGTFTEWSDTSGLKGFSGGLNIMQTDYNNDGLKDIFVLRGAWKGKYGKEPNSLLRNNGNGTFTDVTKKSGLLSFHPTQTATWADFNNDGWLDVFIGNETSDMKDLNPCEFYMNNKDGTFTETAVASGCDITVFVKGVTSGDYNNDGLMDIFISSLSGDKVLLQNTGVKNNVITFKNVTREAGMGSDYTPTFPTWFWDYDNDGWLDILICSYDFQKSLSYYSAAEALNEPVGNRGKPILYHNNHDGTFKNVSAQVGLNKVAFAMGSNFGDIDNDGFLDIYLGTGNPQYTSLVPNKMFKNIGGTKFVDITTSARVGNLQKGHGVSFADMDNDGDEDIYIDMGGAFAGDAYQNSFYINPGQNNNHWINLSLEGVQCNKAAIGAKIKVTFTENGVQRSVYRDLNSGGSFGSNPLMQHIGIGQARNVESVEIKWPGNKALQVFKNLKPDETIAVKEGNTAFVKIIKNKMDFTSEKRGLIGCYPF